MKTQQECWEALIAGRLLISSKSNVAIIIKLIDGRLWSSFPDPQSWIPSDYTCKDPENWSIYEPPKPKVVRWLWANSANRWFSDMFYTEDEIRNCLWANTAIKLEWSRTEFSE